MAEASALLVDGRAQVKAALERIQSDTAFSVRQSWPRTEHDGVLITYGEYSNVSTECSVVDSVSYQVDIWAFDRETVTALSALVNQAMTALGLKRTYSGPDGVSTAGLGYEHKQFRFGRKVDKRTMRLID
ncbi:MAG: hypothetical protein LIO78_02125 [Clostridiales bacterium]|nr:hypothetical protein [Clostridiales bacterium]